MYAVFFLPCVTELLWILFGLRLSFVLEGLGSIKAGYAEPTAAVRVDEDTARDMTELPHESRRGEAG